MTAIQLEDHLAVVRTALRSGEQVTRRSLGQHFLLGGRELRSVVVAAGDLEGRVVVEVGPGPGGLTAALLETRVARVVAIELDAAWAEFSERHLDDPRLQVLRRDVREGSGAFLEQLLHELCEGRPPAVVSNLPYQVASPVLVDLARSTSGVDPVVATVQSEVAERLRAAPGDRRRGLLTVLVGLHCRVRRVRRLAPGAFSPPPKVSSAVVELRRHAPPLAPPEVLERATSLARSAFQERRKMLRGTLRGLVAPERLEHDGSRRPEELGESEWIELARSE